MTSRLHYAAVALALVAGAETANAQTVITREITTEPVETIIQRGPTGTVVTRRPLEMTVPRAPITLRSTTVVDPDEAITTSVEPEETITTRRQTVGVSSSVDAPLVRRSATRAVAPRKAAPRVATVPKQRVTKSTTQGARATTVRRAAPAVAARSTRAVQTVSAPILSPAERRFVYRTVVEERVVPPTVIEPDPLAPPFGVFAGPARDVIGGRVVETYGAAPAVTERVVTTAVANPTLVVGVRVPPTVPLYAFPETLGVRVPAVRSYRYAVIDDRVFLVDPYTNRIVSELEE
jgi:hypothetical protein